MEPYSDPALIVSLDFELHWGLFDHLNGPDHPYWENLLGARHAVQELLSILKKHEIHATWATVGILFARNQKEFSYFLPSTKPEYRRCDLNPYNVPIGEDELDDPMHFAASLVEIIRDTPGQELASHTFSHYYCLEEGQTKEAFREDLSAAQAIASKYGVTLRSVVFPRNQVNPAYLPILSELGFEAYRGNPRCFLYDPEANKYYKNLSMRLLRLADSYSNITGHHTVTWSELADSYPVNVRASCFLRAYSPKLHILDRLRRRRVIESIRHAAEKKEVFHLWWHPHNFGKNLRLNLSGLEEILAEFDGFRRTYGIQSLNMMEVANEAYRIRNEPRSSTG